MIVLRSKPFPKFRALFFGDTNSGCIMPSMIPFPMIKSSVFPQSLIKHPIFHYLDHVFLGCIAYTLRKCKCHALWIIVICELQSITHHSWKIYCCKSPLQANVLVKRASPLCQSGYIFVHYHFETALFCSLKVQQAEATHIHPTWRGNYPYGYGAAVLRLSVRVPIPTPVLADTKFHIYPNLQFRSFTVLTGLKIVEMDVKADGIFFPKRCIYKGTGISTDLVLWTSLLLPIWNRWSLRQPETRGSHIQDWFYFPYEIIVLLNMLIKIITPHWF